MTKKKSHSELEFLRGEIRTLRAQIKHLKKHVSRKGKREHLFEDLEDKAAELAVQEEIEERGEILKKMTCPKCRAPLDVINGGGKIEIYHCSECEYKCSKRTT